MDSDAQENNFTIIEADMSSEMKMNSQDKLRAASVTNASHKNANTSTNGAGNILCTILDSEDPELSARHI
jgi:hypothetical protein